VVETLQLSAPLDSLYLDDRTMMHGVTPISRIDAQLSGWRDVLIVDFDYRTDGSTKYGKEGTSLNS
jgi:hypothetical protein